MKRILLVEDEEKIRRMYSKLLTEEGFDVVETSNAVDAYDLLVQNPVDLILLDIKMPQVEGNLLYEILQSFHIGDNVLVASVYPIDVQQRLVPGARDYYDKSHGIEVLLEKIRKILV